MAEEGKPMEVEAAATEPAAPEPAESAEPPVPAEPPVSQAAPEAEPPAARPKTRKKKTVRESPATPEAPRVKRQDPRTQTPPSIVVDQAFWAGLLATQKAMKREARQETLSNFRIFG